MLPVSNITFEQKPGGILFKWDNANTGLSYVEILLKKSKCRKARKNAPQKVTTSLQGEYVQSTQSGHGIVIQNGAHAGRLVILTTCTKTGVNIQ